MANIKNQTHSEIYHQDAASPQSPGLLKAVLFCMICVNWISKGYSETLTVKGPVTLSCTLPDFTGDIEWINNTFNDSKVLTTCKMNTLKCSNNEQDTFGYFQYSAMRNDTFTWITITSDMEGYEGSSIIACKSHEKVLQTFDVKFVSENKDMSPRCNVVPLEFDSSKIKFKCEVDIMPRSESKLQIWGAGKNFTDLHEYVYSVVDYYSFVDIKNASCQMTVSGVKESCTFPTGIRINKQIMGNNVLFECDPSFDIKNQTIYWQFLNSEMDLVNINESLWFSVERRIMIIRNISSINKKGVMIKCQITQTNKHNFTSVRGVGFVSLKPHEVENSDDTNDRNKCSEDKINGCSEAKDCEVYMALTFVFLSFFLIVFITAILMFIWLRRNKNREDPKAERPKNISRRHSRNEYEMHELGSRESLQQQDAVTSNGHRCIVAPQQEIEVV